MPATATPLTDDDIEQVGFQIFNDDGGPTNVNNASPLAGLNAGASIQVGTKARIRLRLRQSVSDNTAFRYLLEYRINGGAWSAVDAATSVRGAASTAFADASPTTQRFGTAPFVPGEGISTTRNSAAIAINSGGAPYFTEIEWNILLNAGTIGDVIQFRAVAMTTAWMGGAYTAQPLTVYTVYPQINVAAANAPAVSIERAEVFEGIQLGIEPTPGQVTAATKRLLSTMLDLDPKFNKKAFRPSGSKFNTAVTSGKDYSEGKITGTLAYFDAIYLFNSLLCREQISTPATNGIFVVNLGNPTAGTFTLGFDSVANPTQVTAAIPYNATAAAVLAALQNLSSIGQYAVKVTGPAGGPYTVVFQNSLNRTGKLLAGNGTALTGGTFGVTTTAATLTRRRIYVPRFNQPDAFQTYTMEKGGNAGAAQAAFGCLSQMGVTFTKDDCQVQGQIFAQPMAEPFTLSTGVQDVPVLPVDPLSVSVYLGDTPVGMQRMTRCLKSEFTVGNRQKPFFTLDDSRQGFSGTVETPIDAKIKLTVEHDSNGIALFYKVRSSQTQYIKIEAIGPEIEPGFPFRIAIIAPVKFLDAPRGAEDDLYCSMPDATVVYDPAFGAAIWVEIDTPLPAL